MSFDLGHMVQHIQWTDKIKEFNSKLVEVLVNPSNTDIINKIGVMLLKHEMEMDNEEDHQAVMSAVTKENGDLFKLMVEVVNMHKEGLK